MTATEGLLMGFIGTTITLVGFFIAFLVATKAKKSKKEINEEERLRKIFPDFKTK